MFRKIGLNGLDKNCEIFSDQGSLVYTSRLGLDLVKNKSRLDRVVESDFADSGKTAAHAYLILLLLSMLIAIELVSFFGFSYIKSHSNFYSFD